MSPPAWKYLARAGDDRDPNCLPGQRRQGGAKVVVQGVGEGIHRRTVHGDDGDPVLQREINVSSSCLARHEADVCVVNG